MPKEKKQPKPLYKIERFLIFLGFEETERDTSYITYTKEDISEGLEYKLEVNLFINRGNIYQHEWEINVYDTNPTVIIYNKVDDKNINEQIEEEKKAVEVLACRAKLLATNIEILDDPWEYGGNPC